MKEDVLMQVQRKRKGFTLVEIMIVVVIVGLLAALAIPAFARVRETTKHTQFFNDVRIFKDAIEIYAMEHGEYPRDSDEGKLWEELQPFFSKQIFEGGTPIGGLWDVERGENGVISAVGAAGFTVSSDEIVKIDQRFDDGDTSSGRLQLITGNRFYYVIEDE